MSQFRQAIRSDRTFSRRLHAVRWPVLTAIFLLTALWSVWPAERFPFDILPTGASVSATVPMFNAWTIWWNADRLKHGLAGYWDAPIFHPERGTFAFSEPQPATWLVAPIVWLTGSPIPAYHVYLIASLVLNGVFAVRLLRVLRTSWPAATVGGVAMLLHPLAHQQSDVLQLIPLWGILWTLEALVKLSRNPSERQGVELGVAFSLVFMTSTHHGLFLALLLGLTAWLTIPLRRWKRWLSGTAWATVTSGILLLPLLWPMHQILTQHAFNRQTSMVKSLSATPSAWLQVAPTAWIHFTRDEFRSAYQLSPGWLRTGLALGAVLLLFVRRSRQRWPAVFLAALGCWAFVWSFGSNLRIGSWQPWLMLAEWVPAISQVRSVFRFAYFVQLVVILLAAVGLSELARYLQARQNAHHRCWLFRAVFAIAAAVIAFEVPPAPVRLVGVPDVSVERPWVAFLREHTPTGQAAVCLPFAAGYLAQDLDQTARWMLYGVRHRVRLVNGYSGFFPESWYRMVEALTLDPYGERTLDKLSNAGVEFIVIQRRMMPRSVTAAVPSERFQLTQVFQDESGVEIWRLARHSTRH